MATYYQKNKDKIKEYYNQNREKINQRRREYYQKNKDKFKEYNEARKDKINAYYRTYRKNNKKKLNEYLRNYRKIRYIVCDKNGNFLFEGTKKEVVEFTHLTTSEIRCAVLSGDLFHDFFIDLC